MLELAGRTVSAIAVFAAEAIRLLFAVAGADKWAVTDLAIAFVFLGALRRAIEGDCAAVTVGKAPLICLCDASRVICSCAAIPI